MTSPLTPSQTVGPFFDIGLPWDAGPFVVPAGTEGAFWVRGRVLDGAGEPLPDALVETSQANPSGRRGLGRCATDPDGRWGILTVMPDAVGDGAPHLDLTLFARGLLHHVLTRVYFPEHADRHTTDPALGVVAPARRRTLIADPDADGYRFDLHLQGPDETVFFVF